MAVDARKFPRAIERVCETFKISSLYPEQEASLKALLEGKMCTQVCQLDMESP